MKKPWSVTTTVRSPYRLRDFLSVLKRLEGLEWNSEHQKQYQIYLIKDRFYGYGSPQFYNGLSIENVNLIKDETREVSTDKAREIFNEKNYEDPAMRGRQSLNPLKKLGFVSIRNKNIFITDLGKLFLKEDYDLGEIFFKSFLKWQIPNLDSRDYPSNGFYDIKPFIGTLRLIKLVNYKEHCLGNKPKGVSKKEFCLFVPTLVHYQNIESYADKIIALRRDSNGRTKSEQITIFENYKKRFAIEFLGDEKSSVISKLLKNLQDYGDNAIRYFRFTRYIYIRGNGFYIDLEPRRSVEIESLLNIDSAQSKSFSKKDDYLSYVSDISKPELPWETKVEYIKIVKKLVYEISKYEHKLQKKPLKIEKYQEMASDNLKEYVSFLRSHIKQLQDEETHKRAQDIDQIKHYVNNLNNIFDFKDRPVLLEKLCTLGLYALDDAEWIQPNYPIGDDNEPTYTAPANVPDIECLYKNFNVICEVTMLKDRTQWFHEGQPVMRHLRDFEDKYSKSNSNPTYCLFIAPKLHRDTINTFWNAIKYEYESKKQKIIPLSIKDFVHILEILISVKSKGKFLKHTEISSLYDKILESSTSHENATAWVNSINDTIVSWGNDFNI